MPQKITGAKHPWHLSLRQSPVIQVKTISYRQTNFWPIFLLRISLSHLGITLESMNGLIISSGVGITIGLVTLAIEVFFFKNRQANSSN